AGDDAGAYQALGAAYAGIGQLEDAEKAFKRALALDPNRAEVMVGLAGALVKQGKGAEAKEAAEKAIERIPHWPPAHKTLGDALMRGLKYEDAAVAYRSALAADPKVGAVAPFLGLCYELAGQLEKAHEAYEKTADDPDEMLKSLARRRISRLKVFMGPPSRERTRAGSVPVED